MIVDEPLANTNGHDGADDRFEKAANGAEYESRPREEDTASRIRESENHRDAPEDNDEMVVEAGEDAVIY